MKEAKSWGGKRPGAGRKATGKDPVTAFRLAPALRAKINNWRQKQPGHLTLSETIRRLVGQALASDRSQQRTDEKAAAKAAAMAGSEIDKLVDKTASAAEKASVSAGLLKGHVSFETFAKISANYENAKAAQNNRLSRGRACRDRSRADARLRPREHQA